MPRLVNTLLLYRSLALAQQALEAGATKEEITEAFRVAQHLSGVGCMYVGAQALKELCG
jgi:alkylhydroperoxidase/carboxymuconolactone decarboxylase family protein YurZ